MNETSCNHIIGIRYDYDNTDLIDVESLVKSVKEEHDMYSYCVENKLYHLDFKHNPPHKIDDYFDRRNSLFHRFNFCPYCGEKLNWKRLRILAIDRYKTLCEV